VQHDQLGTALATKAVNKPQVDQSTDRLGINTIGEGDRLPEVSESTNQLDKVMPTEILPCL